jgi:hypothetical protein
MARLRAGYRALSIGVIRAIGSSRLVTVIDVPAFTS